MKATERWAGPVPSSRSFCSDTSAAVPYVWLLGARDLFNCNLFTFKVAAVLDGAGLGTCTWFTSLVTTD